MDLARNWVARKNGIGRMFHVFHAFHRFRKTTQGEILYKSLPKVQKAWNSWNIVLFHNNEIIKEDQNGKIIKVFSN